MKALNNTLRTLMLATALFLLAGCSDWLDYTPKDKQTEEQQFATKNGILSAVNGIYNGMSSSSLYGCYLSYDFIDILGQRYEVNQTDEDSYSRYCRALVDYNYTEEGTQSRISSIWGTAYQTIMNINVVLLNLDRDQDELEGRHLLSPSEYDMLRGEMLACRAMIHFDMLRLFGPCMERTPDGEAIPYNESTDTKILPILTARDVLDNYILRDLTEAQALLQNTDPVIQYGPRAEYDEVSGDNSERYRQLRLNYYAVSVLVARAYLWGGNYEKALKVATDIINDPKVRQYFPAVDAGTLIGNTINPDRMFSTESFFGIYNKDRGLIYDHHFGNDNSGRQLLMPRIGYVDGILFAGTDISDYRYQAQWESGTTLTGDVSRRFTKFKDITDNDRAAAEGTTSDETVILQAQTFYGTYCSLIRLSEAYYIASEAAYKLGDKQNASNYLNYMRIMRGTPFKADILNSYDDMLTKEYIREFIGEGQVFFFFKRRNQAFDNEYNGQKTVSTAIMPPFVYDDTEGVSEEQKEARYKLPLPNSELENR